MLHRPGVRAGADGGPPQLPAVQRGRGGVQCGPALLQQEARVREGTHWANALLPRPMTLQLPWPLLVRAQPRY